MFLVRFRSKKIKNKLKVTNMKKFFLVLGLAFLMAACANNATDNAIETQIDSCTSVCQDTCKNAVDTIIKIDTIEVEKK